jgi:hypothetical protein
MSISLTPEQALSVIWRHAEDKSLHVRGSVCGACWDLAEAERAIKEAKALELADIDSYAAYANHALLVQDKNKKWWSFETDIDLVDKLRGSLA